MEILVVVLIWLVCGFIGSAIMSGKGHGSCGGWALGLLLGPIGIVIALLWRPTIESEAERQLEIDREIRRRRDQGRRGPP